MKRAIYIGPTQEACAEECRSFLNYGMTGEASDTDSFWSQEGKEPCRLFTPDGECGQEILVHTKDLYFGVNSEA